jgi:hypothetical protein
VKKFILLAILLSFILPLQVEAQTQVNSIKFANRPDYHPTTVGNLWRKNDLLIWTYSGGETIIATGAGGGGTLAGLSDVTLGTLYNGQVLGYDGISGQWENKWPWETSVDGRYVTTATMQTISGAKDFTAGLSYAGVQVATSVASCTDTNLTTLADGHFMRWSAGLGRWHPVALPPSVADLASLTDVDVTTRGSGHLLGYSGTQWYNITPSSLPTDSRYVTKTATQTISGDKDFTGNLSRNGVTVATSIASCSDTLLSTLANGHFLRWNGSSGRWHPVTLPPSITDLASLTDVDVTTRSANDILQYDGTKWSNRAAAATTPSDLVLHIATTGSASANGLTTATAVDTFETATRRIPLGYSGTVYLRYHPGTYKGWIWRGRSTDQSYLPNAWGEVTLVVEGDTGVKSDVVFATPADYWSGNPGGGSFTFGIVGPGASVAFRNITVQTTDSRPYDYAVGFEVAYGASVKVLDCDIIYGPSTNLYGVAFGVYGRSKAFVSNVTYTCNDPNNYYEVMSVRDNSEIEFSVFTATGVDDFGWTYNHSRTVLWGPITVTRQAVASSYSWMMQFDDNSTGLLCGPITFNNCAGNRGGVRVIGGSDLMLYDYVTTFNVMQGGGGLAVHDASSVRSWGGSVVTSGPSLVSKGGTAYSFVSASYGGGHAGWSLPLTAINMTTGISLAENATLNTVGAPVFTNVTNNYTTTMDGAYDKVGYSAPDRFWSGRNVVVPSTLTVASDAVTVTKSSHVLNGQGAAADDLVTINGGEWVGQQLELIRGNADITIKPWVGNIRGNENIVLKDVHDRINLEYNGTNWLVSSKYLTTRAPLSVTYYVATTGVATNDGLTLGSAVNTLEVAMQKVPSDWRGQVKLVCFTGTYAGLHLDGTRNAGSTSSTYPAEIVVESLTGVPANVTFNAVGVGGVASRIFTATRGASLLLKNVTIDSQPTNAYAVAALDGGNIVVDNVAAIFDYTYAVFLYSSGFNSLVTAKTALTLTGVGSSGILCQAEEQGNIVLNSGTTVTLTSPYAVGMVLGKGSLLKVMCTLPLNFGAGGTAISAQGGGTLLLRYGTLSSTNATANCITISGGSEFQTFGGTINLDGADVANTAIMLTYGSSMVCDGTSITLNDFGTALSIDTGSSFRTGSTPNISSSNLGLSIIGGGDYIGTLPTYTGNVTNYTVTDGRYATDRFINGRVTYVGSTLTIAADAVTVTNSRHVLNGQGAVADDLSTINGGVTAGQRLTLVRGNANITIKDSTGNIRCGADIVLDDINDRAEFDFDGTNWCLTASSIPVPPSNYVTTDTTQSISGVKTFQASVKNTGRVSYAISTNPISSTVDYVFCNISGGSINLGLPVVDGKTWKVKVTAHAASNVVTLTPVSGNIDGAVYNDVVLNGLNTSCEVYCDGTNFWLY